MQKSRTKVRGFACIFFVNASWRRRWDSNPRALAGYLISSQARYDHFDTPPWEIYSVFSTNNMISSQPRYDHFDTAACIFCNISPQKAPRKKERTTKIFLLDDTSKALKNQGFSKTVPKWSLVFDSALLWPLRYRCVYFRNISPQKAPRKKERTTKLFLLDDTSKALKNQGFSEK